jgi:predicted Rossmann-fold nucleotide-binding protein
MQTKRIEPMPVLLFGEEFWRRVVDFDALVEYGVIRPEDLELFSFVDSAEAAVEIIAAGR